MQSWLSTSHELRCCNSLIADLREMNSPQMGDFWVRKYIVFVIVMAKLLLVWMYTTSVIFLLWKVMYVIKNETKIMAHWLVLLCNIINCIFEYY